MLKDISALKKKKTSPHLLLMYLLQTLPPILERRGLALLFITCKMTKYFGVNEEVLLVHLKVTRAYSMSLDKK